jgi:hypothetical protein
MGLHTQNHSVSVSFLRRGLLLCGTSSLYEKNSCTYVLNNSGWRFEYDTNYHAHLKSDYSSHGSHGMPSMQEASDNRVPLHPLHIFILVLCCHGVSSKDMSEISCFIYIVFVIIGNGRCLVLAIECIRTTTLERK